MWLNFQTLLKINCFVIILSEVNNSIDIENIAFGCIVYGHYLGEDRCTISNNSKIMLCTVSETMLLRM